MVHARRWATTPWSNANAAASVLEFTPNFVKMLERWRATVFSEMNSVAATSRLL